jgi:hypothetical protein
VFWRLGLRKGEAFFPKESFGDFLKNSPEIPYEMDVFCLIVLEISLRVQG